MREHDALNHNIIDYRPTIERGKQIMTEVNKDLGKEVYQVSEPIAQLKQYSPSVILQAFSNVIDKSNKVLQGLEKELNGVKVGTITFKDYKKALESSNYDVIDEFEGEHINSIEGDVKVELYSIVKSVNDDIKDLKDFFENQSYGKNPTLEEASRMDDVLIDKLTEYEKSGSSDVNYTSIYLDVQLNKAFSDKCDNTSSFLDKAMDVIYDNGMGSVETLDEGVKPLVSNVFSKSSKENLEDRNKLKQINDSSIRQSAVSRAFNSRRTFLDSLQSLQVINKIKDDDMRNQLLVSVQETGYQMEASLTDMHKSVEMENIYLSDFVETIGRKQKVRKSYR